jgi:hypothetical protein
MSKWQHRKTLSDPAETSSFPSHQFDPSHLLTWTHHTMSSPTIHGIARKHGKLQLRPGEGMCETAASRLAVIQRGGAPQSVYGRRLSQKIDMDNYVGNWLVGAGWKAEEVAAAAAADPPEAAFAESMAQSCFAGPLPGLAKTDIITDLLTDTSDVNDEIADWATKTDDANLVSLTSARSSVLSSISERSSYFQLQPRVRQASKRLNQSTQIQNRYIVFPECAVSNGKHDSIRENETRCWRDIEALMSPVEECTRALLTGADYSVGSADETSAEALGV